MRAKRDYWVCFANPPALAGRPIAFGISLIGADTGRGGWPLDVPCIRASPQGMRLQPQRARRWVDQCRHRRRPGSAVTERASGYTSALTEIRMTRSIVEPAMHSPQPVFDPKIVDPREFTFVVGHNSEAQRERMRGDKQVVCADRLPVCSRRALS